MTIELGIEPLTRDELVRVARHYEPLTLSAEVIERLASSATPSTLWSTAAKPSTASRRVRFARDDLDLARASTRLAALPDSLARGRRRARSRSGSRARHDGLASHEPLQWGIGSATLDGRGVRGFDQRQHHARRPRVRFTRMFGRPRPTRARGARTHGRRRRARRRRERVDAPSMCWATRGSHP